MKKLKKKLFVNYLTIMIYVNFINWIYYCY